MLRLLIVDDEHIIREGVTQILLSQSEVPIDVKSAASGVEGLELAAQWRPEVALVDINMPEMDGFAFIDQMRWRLGPKCCDFVVLTGYDEYQYAVSALRRQVVDYLLKPVDAGQLLRILSGMERDLRRRQGETRTRLRRDVKANMVYQEPLGALETEEEELRRLLCGAFLSAVLAVKGQAPLPCEECLGRAAADELDASPQEVAVLALSTMQGGAYLISTPGPLRAGALQRAFQGPLFKDNGPRIGIWTGEPLPAALSRLPQIYLEAWKNMLAHALACPLPAHTWDAEDACARALPYAEIARWHSPERAQAGIEGAADALSALPLGYLRGFAHLCAALKLHGQQTQGTAYPNHIALARLRTAEAPLSRAEFAAWCLHALEEAGVLGEDGTQERYSPSVAQALRYIGNHFQTLQSIDQVAAQVHLHPNYLSTLLKKETGMSFVPYLNALRVAQAKQLLLADSQATVEWVADKVGFQTPRHFYKVFKETTGLSPGRFRGASDIFE